MRPDTLINVRNAAALLLKCAIEEDDASLLMIATATFAHVLAKGVDEETLRNIFREAGLPELLTKVLRGLHRLVRPSRKMATAEQRNQMEAFARRVEMIDAEHSELDLHVIFERNDRGYQAWLVEDPRHVGYGATFTEAREAFTAGLQRYFRVLQREHRPPEGMRAYVLRLHSAWIANP